MKLTRLFRYTLLIPILLSFLFINQNLPVSAANEELMGRLSVVWGDGAPGSGADAQTLFSLVDDNNHITQLVFGDALSTPMDKILSLKDQPVIVQGVLADRAGSQTFLVQDLQPEGDILLQPQAVTGSQPWVSILCKFSDVSAEPKTPAYFADMYRSTYPGFDHYWREVSYNNINMVGAGATNRWYTLPHPRSYYINSNNQADLDKLRTDCTGVADSAVYYPNYVGINMMFNDSLGCCAWGGYNYMTLDGVNRMWRLTWEPPWGYEDICVIAHEMGHGFGFPHSSGNYGQTYDNQWDVMSDTWSNCDHSEDPTYGCLGQNTITYHLDKDGWIPAGKKITVNLNQYRQVTLEQTDLPQTGNPLMIVIPINGSTSNYYTVEVRRNVGYDIKLPGQGVIIHEVNTGRDRPAYVVDSDGNGNTGDAGAIWIVGETFTSGNISVRVDSATASGFVVTVKNNYAAPTPPTLISPLDYTDSQSPTYQWSRVDGATSYEILIQTTAGGTLHNATYTAAEAGCESASTCQVIPSLTLDYATYYWWVRAVTGTTPGEWSARGDFRVRLPAPTPVSPPPDPGNWTPTYTWQKLSQTVESYNLLVYDAANNKVVDQSYTPIQASCTTNCQATPASLGQGPFTWYVRAYTAAAGYGKPSEGRTFNTPTPAPAPTLVTPANNSTAADFTPTYTWNDVAAAQNFKLWLGKPDGTQTFAQWYTRSEAHCSAGTCWVKPDQLINGGQNRWYVKSYNPSGGAWSSYNDFNSPPAATKPSLVSPVLGAATTTFYPEYRWNEVSNATQYKLAVYDGGGIQVFSGWFTKAQSNCSASVCRVTPDTALGAGSHTWYVKSYNPAGGIWSDPGWFNTPSAAAGQPSLSYPVDNIIITNHNPTFSWTGDARATCYKLYLLTQAGVVVFSQWYTPIETNCKNGTACSVTPTTNLANGDYKWYVKSYNPNGGVWSSEKQFKVQ